MLISARHRLVSIDPAMGDPSDSAVDELESPRVVHCNIVRHAPTLSVAILITE